MCRILYRLLASLARLAVRSGRSKDLEIIVLRHQLAVLRRQNNRPALADEDRALLGAIAAALPRRRRAGWLVTPETLLRWHRRRIARHWTQPCRVPGRPCTSVELRHLIIDMATNNPTWVTAASPASSPVSATGYYIAHYNMHRPHRSLDQRPPRHTTPDNNTTDHPLPLRLVRTTRCDGLINEYKQAA